MYKSLSEMKPGQKFVLTKEFGRIYNSEYVIEHFREDGICCSCGLLWYDREVDWNATNALYFETKDTKDNYTAEIHALLESQKAKGLSKYGVGLEDGTVGLIEGINHAMEECADILFYLAHVKAKLMEKGE